MGSIIPTYVLFIVNKSKSVLAPSLFLSLLLSRQKNKRPKSLISESCWLEPRMPCPDRSRQHSRLALPAHPGWEFLIPPLWFPRNRRGCSCSQPPPVPSLPSDTALPTWRLNTNFQTSAHPERKGSNGFLPPMVLLLRAGCDSYRRAANQLDRHTSVLETGVVTEGNRLKFSKTWTAS